MARNDFSGPASREWTSNLLAGGEAGLCYRASIEAYDTLNATQGAGSSQVCLPVRISECKTPQADGTCPPTGSECTEYDTECNLSPIVINMGRGGYALTGLDDPVTFDLDADGRAETSGWTERESAMAFLALDRNHNAAIDDGAELFGDATPTPFGRAANGFEALAQYDGNGDGSIDAGDVIWHALLLWKDSNHDGRTDAAELMRLADSDITTLGLDYQQNGRRDPYGNALRYKSHLNNARGAAPYYDVFFIVRR